MNLPLPACLFLGGFSAGLASSLITTPVEYAKVRAQMNSGGKGSIRLLIDPFLQESLGGFNKVYKGLSLSLLK
jgi:hypothetical protein